MAICELGTRKDLVVRSETMTAQFNVREDGPLRAAKVFDNVNDPCQETNRASDPTRSDEIERLKKMAVRYNESIHVMDPPEYDCRINWHRIPRPEIDEYLERRSEV